VIRQAISCDICGAGKRQTNHWFVCYEQSGELRVSGWNSRYLLCSGVKHLCGESCLHTLVSEFLAKSLSGRSPQAAAIVDVQLPVVEAENGVTAEARSFRQSITQATESSPRSSHHVPRALERHPRSHGCTERKTS